MSRGVTKSLGTLGVLCILCLVSLQAQQPTYETLKAEAEKYYAEGSYALAYSLYLKADAMELPPTEARWVDFRVADTQWRAHAATYSYDTTKYEQAQQQLETLVQELQPEKAHNRLWADVQESLGGLWHRRRAGSDWEKARSHYQQALDWWAEAHDVDSARENYIRIVRSTADVRDGYFFGPQDWLENALKIAVNDNDKAFAHYFVARQLTSWGSTVAQHRRAAQEYETIIKMGKSTEWYDDALYQYAGWLAAPRSAAGAESGDGQSEPDYVKTVEMYRRLIQEYEPGETPYGGQAGQQIQNITKPTVDVIVSNLFTPGSEMQYHLAWRNVKTIEFALYKVDLTEDFNVSARLAPVFQVQWVHYLDLSKGQKVRSWLKETGDKNDHKPLQETMRLEGGLPLGAYVIEAKAGDERARDAILVTDMTVVLKSARKQALVYVCNARDGAPVADAKVSLFANYNYGSRWETHSMQTNQDGIAVFNFTGDRGSEGLFVTAAVGDRQAFSTGYTYGDYLYQSWRIYAFTDRPAYRPGEQVQWKFIARTHDGSVYSTPARQTIRFRIRGPRDFSVQEGELKLNAFGSAWGSLDLTDSMSLGEYYIEFRNEKGQYIGGTQQLFRLEEYKLPEFKVRVQTPQENRRKKTFRLGDTIQVEIQAEYYFGGPVAHATVEAFVDQRPFTHSWRPPRQMPWYYEPPPNRWGSGEVVKRESLRTDANGKATLTFEMPRYADQDFEYYIQANVTDASRREVIAGSTVHVTRQRYYTYLQPEHNLYDPRDKVQINIKTVDANDQPVSATGSINVIRDYWVESWQDPNGREITGDELRRLRQQTHPFPPPPRTPGEPPWQLKFQGYHHEDVLTTSLTTDDRGEALFTFTPGREGYFRVAWMAPDDSGEPIKAEATIWATTTATTDLGYRHGGVEIIVDTDTIRTGQEVPVLISAPMSNRYVLFSVESQELHSYQLLHLSGTVKLTELAIEEQHTPNIFLAAAMVSDNQLFRDTEEVIVPPVDQFLEVQVSSDREQYKPREEGTLTVTTRDHNGNPVAAEVALGFVDEAIYYIQQDYAEDPRQFYYGTKRQHLIDMHSTFEQGKMIRRYQQVEAMTVVMAPLRPDVDVRTDFRTTALWLPNVITGKNGKATVKVKFPELLTSWKATARAATQGNQFGIATTTARTSQPLTVRLQAPRFFVVGDTVTVSAVINNNTADAMMVLPSLTAEGVRITNRGMWLPIRVEAKGEARADWTVSVERPGNAKLKVTARGGKYADAMEKTYAVYEHGIEKLIVKSGKVRGDDVTVKLDIPKERKPESTTLTVQVTPSMAVMMLDALPYLIDYPYGCTEQTMSRFLPAAIVTKTLKDLGLTPEPIMGKIFGGIEQQHVSRTQPQGKSDLHQLDEMIQQGLVRLYDFQHSDGSWGWWKESPSDHFMTAYVVWGLTLARETGIEVDQNVLSRGVEYLDKELVEEEVNYDQQAWMLHALAAYYASTKPGGISQFQTKAFENLWTNRDRLNAYTRALLALSAHSFGYADRAQTLVRNLENGVKIDRTPDASALVRGQQSHEAAIGTAHWGEDGIYWRWSDGGVEATSVALRALLAIDPQNKLIEPVMNWLVKNRRGAQWSNTRDTAIVVLTLNDYLKLSGELVPEMEYELMVNGRSIVTRRLTAQDALSAPSRFEISREVIRDGANDIRIVRRSGRGPIYFAAQAKFFSLEEPITPAGNEIFVRRQYYKLVGRPTLLKGYVYDRVPLSDGETVTSGDRVEAVITIEAKNNYEYLVFEDLKPAGLEAVQIRSGEPLYAHELKSSEVERDAVQSAIRNLQSAIGHTGRSRWVYQELRDRKVALFIDKLPQGVWEIRYDLRAEVPGQFHALPVVGHAMYVPEIRCNSVEVRIDVADSK